MRVVAERLNVTPMALYYYVETKDALVKLVADAVVAKVRLPELGGNWRAGMITSMEDYRRTVARYPGVAAVLLHGGILPHARRLVARQLEILELAGFSPGDARRGFAAYHLLVLGRLTIDEAQRTRPERGPAHVQDPAVDAYLAELQGEPAFTEAVGVFLNEMSAKLKLVEGNQRARN